MSRVLPRVVEPETLDALAADDPAARRSRRDLRRIHLAMGTRPILRGALRGMSVPAPRPPRVLELGAGDGSLLLGVAAAAGPGWQGAELTLLDRRPAVDTATLAAYARLGWRAGAVAADALDWAARADGPAAAAGGGAAADAIAVTDAAAGAHAATAAHAAAPLRPARRGDAAGGAAGSRADAPDGRRWDLVVASLFLHHFEGAALASLLAAAAARCDRFIACEPRRSRLALAGSHLVGALGAGPVTREDAVTSVRAGFRDGELTALWPGRPGAWRVDERAAGPFAHLFVAERIGADDDRGAARGPAAGRAGATGRGPDGGPVAAGDAGGTAQRSAAGRAGTREGAAAQARAGAGDAAAAAAAGR